MYTHQYSSLFLSILEDKSTGANNITWTTKNKQLSLEPNPALETGNSLVIFSLSFALARVTSMAIFRGIYS